MEHSAGTDGLQVAQFNLAVLRHPLGHPDTQGFVDLIDDTNAHAEASPGFVWRHGIDTRDVDDLPYDDKRITVNASVWESPQHLRDFAYRGFHRGVFRRRSEWFVDSGAVMWWIEQGTRPSLHECMVRMDFYGEFGSTPYAFATGERPPVLVIRTGGAERPEVCALLDDAGVAADGGQRIDVAWLHDTAVAFAITHADHAGERPAAWTLDAIRVAPDHRRGRLGAALVRSVMVAAEAAGIAALHAVVAEADDATRALLTRLGFAVADRVPSGGQAFLTAPIGRIREWKRPASRGSTGPP